MKKIDTLVALCTCPDAETAENISRQLVSGGLAACVNIVPGIRSCYLWQGRIEQDNELLLLIKTRAACFDALQQAIVELHPYELPEVIAVPIDRGLPAYLDWISENTHTP